MAVDHIQPSSRSLQNPVHPTITVEQVSELVERFYKRVHENTDLAPVFATQTKIEWDDHLAKMKSFWRSVLLKTGEYKGKPVPKHQRLHSVETHHFEQWLKLFSRTTRDVFSAEAAPLVDAAARRIATSLWLSRNQDPFASPPDWSASKPSDQAADIQC